MKGKTNVYYAFYNTSMKKKLIKRISITVGTSIIICIASVLITNLILANIVNIGSKFTDNKYALVYFEKLEALPKSLPIIFIVFMGLFDLFLLYLCFPKKILYILITILLFLITLLVIFMLTRMGDYFVFQVIENMRDANV